MKDNYEELDKIAREPLLRRELFSQPVVIDKLELLSLGKTFITRVISRSGTVGLCVNNSLWMENLYPIQLNRIFPLFLERDARDLDSLIDEAYLYRNNYKLQGFALWIPLASVEFAILDMLGRIAGVTMGEVIGERRRNDIGVYRANNCRGKSPEESIEQILKTREETGARAVKFKIGGRMDAPESPVGRSETLIRKIRDVLGLETEIYADANGSYSDPEEAIRIGHLMEDHGLNVLEEPAPFDRYEDMKIISDALSIPMASGGGESSFNNVRWMIGRGVYNIYQMDPFYFGGMIRSRRIARMAESRGHTYQPHISGTGLGYIYMMHLVSVVPNAETYHEFKGLSREIPFSCETSDLKTCDGRLIIPNGPGSGVEIDSDFLSRFRRVDP